MPSSTEKKLIVTKKDYKSLTGSEIAFKSLRVIMHDKDAENIIPGAMLSLRTFNQVLKCQHEAVYSKLHLIIPQLFPYEETWSHRDTTEEIDNYTRGECHMKLVMTFTRNGSLRIEDYFTKEDNGGFKAKTDRDGDRHKAVEEAKYHLSDTYINANAKVKTLLDKGFFTHKISTDLASVASSIRFSSADIGYNGFTEAKTSVTVDLLLVDLRPAGVVEDTPVQTDL